MAADTIVAISSPTGNSFKGIIRLSGPRALTLVQNALDNPINRKTWSSIICALAIRLFPRHTFNNAKRSEFIPSKAGLYAPRLCRIPVTLYLMPAPHSYTREDVVELHLLGSRILIESVLQYFIRSGARLARPGEFTQRAFLNGRITLAQSEAVLNIIHSSSKREHHLAISQLCRHSRAGLEEIAGRIFDLLTRIELALDFSDQDIEIIPLKQIKKSLIRITAGIKKNMTESAGRSMGRDGVICVLCGRPNTGKSSLFNRLVYNRRNIVSPVPGTTRDYIEGKMVCRNTNFLILDTAGVSQTIFGTDRSTRQTHQAVQQADIYLLVIDASSGLTKEDKSLLKRFNPAQTIIVANKTDLLRRNSAFRIPHSAIISCSARTGQGLAGLKTALTDMAKSSPPDRSSDTTLINLRQQENLKTVLELLNKALSCANREMPYEFIASDLRQAIDALATGGFSASRTIIPEKILNRIFARFCIGK